MSIQYPILKFLSVLRITIPCPETSVKRKNPPTKPYTVSGCPTVSEAIPGTLLSSETVGSGSSRDKRLRGSCRSRVA